MKVIVVVALLVVVASGKLQKCQPPSSQDKEPLQLENVFGSWYELRSSDNWWFKTTHKCAQVDILAGSPNIKFKRTSINKAWFWTKSVDEGVVTMDATDPWTLTFSWKSWGMSHSDGPYHILGTDYRNYLILWKCENHWYKDFTTEAYILGRHRDTDLAKFKTEIDGYLKIIKESMSNYYEDNQSDCK